MYLGYSESMQPAMIPVSMLEERRRLGHDRFDEVWEGVLHLVPFPSTRHQAIIRRLVRALEAVAERRGQATLEIFIGTEPAASSSLGLELRVEGTNLLIRDGEHAHTVDIRDVV